MDNEKTYDASQDVKFEERTTTDSLRTDGKISEYKFKILVRDKPALQGTLSREDMDLIYNLYTREGSDLSRAAVSRYFPLFTVQEFKKILRAFNITKDSAPFPPHIVEEKTTEELIQLTLQRKENNYLKKYQQNKEQLHVQKYHEVLKANHELKQSVANFREFIGDLKFDFSIKINKPEFSTNRTLIVYLSDMHVGADVSDYSVYNNTYNFEEIQRRMQIVVNKALNIAALSGCTNLIVCNIGDSLDGYNGQTTRTGHMLPQNMNNKDQFKNYLTAMLDMFKVFSESEQFYSIKYICVEGGNHDGDFGYITNKALEASLSYLIPEIEVRIFDKFMDYFIVNDHTFILCHGKDAKDMFKNMPLTLNDKIENQINEYIDYLGLNGNIHFIKGDLHQTATTYGKKFRYKSVSSFFGSSEWIHKNFGNTKAAIDFEVITNDQILETHILLN